MGIEGTLTINLNLVSKLPNVAALELIGTEISKNNFPTMKNSHKILMKKKIKITLKAYYSLYYFIILNVFQCFPGRTLRGLSKEQDHAMPAYLTNEAKIAFSGN